MNKECIHNLNILKELINKISLENYTKNSKSLSNSTIGQHSRHIIEFYQCFVKGIESKVIEYDARKRSILIETDKNYCIEKINELIKSLCEKIKNKDIIIVYNNSDFENQQSESKSNLERELIYCVDHAIHHQALIKIALIEFKLDYLINDEFGMAYSTIRNKKKCVQ
jgi:uncharacterized damage-inducible protein DinB